MSFWAFVGTIPLCATALDVFSSPFATSTSQPNGQTRVATDAIDQRELQLARRTWGRVSKDTSRAEALGTTPCIARVDGRDFQVGPVPGHYASIESVPWEQLRGGDTVRIFFRADAYRGKFLLSTTATAERPVRVCGVAGPDGERPVIEGSGASSRRELKYGHPLHESRSIVLINRRAEQAWESNPGGILIDGLHFRGAHPRNHFKDTEGLERQYSDFGACIWIERGSSITVADNEISDCSQAIFSKSTDEASFTVTRDIRIAGNYFHDNGVAGSIHTHTTYIQSVGVTYEFNRYGRLANSAMGNSIKDRSVGTVIRYNRIEDGARALDLVEAEDYPMTAKADGRYRETYVYGNQISKDGSKGSAIHYGGDHNGSSPGASWGEPNNRKGTLYFFHNTVHITGAGYGVLFQLSTTEEHAQIWNNILLFDATIPSARIRAGTDVGTRWMPGGTITLGTNWISEPWSDSAQRPNWRGRILSRMCTFVNVGKCTLARQFQMGAPLIGSENMISGKYIPIELSTMRPLGSETSLELNDISRGPVVSKKYSVNWQLGSDGIPWPRAHNPGKIRLGAVDY